MPYHLVNLWQTKEERKEKYYLARSLGANSSHALRMRDWRLSKIERYYHLIGNGHSEWQYKLLLIYNEHYYKPRDIINNFEK